MFSTIPKFVFDKIVFMYVYVINVTISLKSYFITIGIVKRAFSCRYRFSKDTHFSRFF